MAAVIPFAFAAVAGAQTWEPSSGPEGGIVNALTFQDGSIFAGTESGVYQSLDDGASWVLTDPQLSDSVNALEVQGTSIFAGTYQGGIFKSADAGANWSAASGGLSDVSGGVWSLGVMGNRLFAGTFCCIFNSDDGGASWTQSSTPLQANYIRAFEFQNGIAYVAAGPTTFGGGGVYKSFDGGESWFASSQGLGNLDVRSLLSSSGALFAGTFNGLFRSNNGGATWAASGLDGYPITALLDTGSALLAATSFNFNSRISGGVFLSRDGGLSWSRTDLLEPRYVFALGVSDGVLFAGTSLGVYLSADEGLSWSARKSGMHNTTVNSLFSALGVVLAANSDGDSHEALSVSADGGRTWLSVGTGLPDGFLNVGVNYQIWAVQGNAIYLGTANAGVYKSIDRGKTWLPSNAGISTLGVTALGGSETVLFAASGNRLFRSVDGGNTWTLGQTGIPDYEEIQSFAFVNGAVFADGFFGFYKSLDGGESWAPLGQATVQCGCYAVVAGSEGELFAFNPSAEGPFIVSRDGGASWVSPASPPPIPVYLVKPVGKTVFVAGTRGIYFTSDDGASWQELNQGLVRTNVGSLVVSGNRLFAAVPGDGIQALTLHVMREPVERLSVPSRIPHAIPLR